MNYDDRRTWANNLRVELTAFLRGVADAVERGDLDALDVRQALFDGDGYTIGCPISEADGTSPPANKDHAAQIGRLNETVRRLRMRSLTL